MTTPFRRLPFSVSVVLLSALLGFAPSGPFRADDTPAGDGNGKAKQGWMFNRLRGDGETPAREKAPDEEPSRSAYDVKDLRNPLEKIRRSVMASEPSVMAYVERIERGNATAAQLNDFAGFLLRRGVPGLAVSFQKAATDLEPGQPSLWVNLGTIEQARGKGGAASSAYKRALDLDPTNGMAYYGLGVVADANGEYEEAIDYYRRALLIDPSLADPKVNPQVVNNERMMAVQLLLAKDRAGAMSLPLLPADPGASQRDKSPRPELPPAER